MFFRPQSWDRSTSPKLDKPDDKTDIQDTAAPTNTPRLLSRSPSPSTTLLNSKTLQNTLLNSYGNNNNNNNTITNNNNNGVDDTYLNETTTENKVTSILSPHFSVFQALNNPDLELSNNNSNIVNDKNEYTTNGAIIPQDNKEFASPSASASASAIELKYKFNEELEQSMNNPYLNDFSITSWQSVCGNPSSEYDLRNFRSDSPKLTSNNNTCTNTTNSIPKSTYRSTLSFNRSNLPFDGFKSPAVGSILSSSDAEDKRFDYFEEEEEDKDENEINKETENRNELVKLITDIKPEPNALVSITDNSNIDSNFASPGTALKNSKNSMESTALRNVNDNSEIVQNKSISLSESSQLKLAALNRVIVFDSDDELHDLTDNDDFEFDFKSTINNTINKNNKSSSLLQSTSSAMIPSFIMPRVSMSESSSKNTDGAGITSSLVAAAAAAAAATTTAATVSSSNLFENDDTLSIKIIGDYNNSITDRLKKYKKLLYNISINEKFTINGSNEKDLFIYIFNEHSINKLSQNHHKNLMNKYINKPILPIIITNKSKQDSIVGKFENLKILKKLFFICEPIKLTSFNDDLIELVNFLSNLNTNSIDNLFRDLKLNENLLNLNQVNSIILENSRNNINKHDINIEKLSNYKINSQFDNSNPSSIRKRRTKIDDFEKIGNNFKAGDDNNEFSKSLNLSDVNIIHNSNSKNNINNEINKNKLNKRRSSHSNSHSSNNNNKKNSSKKNDYKRIKDGLILGITFGVVSLTLVYIWKETFEIDEFNEVLNNSSDINIIHSSSINGSGGDGTSGTSGTTGNSRGAISLLKTSKPVNFIKKIIRDMNKTELLDYSSYSTFDEGIDIPQIDLSQYSSTVSGRSTQNQTSNYYPASSSMEYSHSLSSDINELKNFFASSSYMIVEKSKLTLIHLFNLASAFLPNLIAACLLS